MELTKKYDLINKDIININAKNPIEIFNNIISKGYINIHGPEHHFFILNIIVI